MLRDGFCKNSVFRVIAAARQKC